MKKLTGLIGCILALVALVGATQWTWSTTASSGPAWVLLGPGGQTDTLARISALGVPWFKGGSADPTAFHHDTPGDSLYGLWADSVTAVKFKSLDATGCSNGALMAIGFGATASDTWAIALGAACTASDNFAFAAGNNAAATGFASVAIGGGIASGERAVILGTVSGEAAGSYSVVAGGEGNDQLASGQSAIVLAGINNIARGKGSSAAGRDAIAAADYSVHFRLDTSAAADSANTIGQMRVTGSMVVTDSIRTALYRGDSAAITAVTATRLHGPVTRPALLADSWQVVVGGGPMFKRASAALRVFNDDGTGRRGGNIYLGTIPDSSDIIGAVIYTGDTFAVTGPGNDAAAVWGVGTDSNPTGNWLLTGTEQDIFPGRIPSAAGANASYTLDSLSIAGKNFYNPASRRVYLNWGINWSSAGVLLLKVRSVAILTRDRRIGYQ